MKKYAYIHAGRMQRKKGGTYLGQRGVLHELNHKKKINKYRTGYQESSVDKVFVT